VQLSAHAAQAITRLFEQATGQTLSQERLWRISTTLTPFCRARGIADLDQLARRIEQGTDPELSLDMIDALLNNETSFFRDPAVFDMIADELLPRLAAARAEERRLRIWSAACSSGQEAYSLATLFAEQPERWQGWRIEILGTDISRSAVNRAREGLYSELEVQRGLTARRLLSFFVLEPAKGWRVRRELSALVTFARRSLLGPPPAGGRFDLVLCRNALLYFGKERRSQLLDGLSLAIAADGALLLGAGETLAGLSSRFEPDSVLPTIYRPAIRHGSSNAA